MSIDHQELQPALIMLDALEGNKNGVENAEKRGQKALVVQSVLPINIPQDCKQALEKAGVCFLGPVPGDDLFQQVELPAGWKKKPTDHAMWTHLLDDKDRIRAEIFYKAAFYDRDAFVRATLFFSVKDHEASGDIQVQVVDASNNIYYTGAVLKTPYTGGCSSDSIARFRALKHEQQLGRDWLNKHFPLWLDPSAYW